MNQKKYNWIVAILFFLLLLLIIFIGTSKAMECKSEIIKTSQGIEVCWVCTSNTGQVISIDCYRGKR